MKYFLSLQLLDTKKEFATEAQRNNAFTIALSKLDDMGIPSEHIILKKIDSQQSSFTGAWEEKVVGTN